MGVGGRKRVVAVVDDRVCERIAKVNYFIFVLPARCICPTFCSLLAVWLFGEKKNYTKNKKRPAPSGKASGKVCVPLSLAPPPPSRWPTSGGQQFDSFVSGFRFRVRVSGLRLTHLIHLTFRFETGLGVVPKLGWSNKNKKTRPRRGSPTMPRYKLIIDIFYKVARS